MIKKQKKTIKTEFEGSFQNQKFDNISCNLNYNFKKMYVLG